MTTASELPPDVVTAIADGNTIKAIKLLRRDRGLSLQEAKTVVESYRLGEPQPVYQASAELDDLPDDVQAEIEAGHRIKAIKLLRAHHNLCLRSAKELVDEEYYSIHPAKPSGNRLMGLGVVVLVCTALVTLSVVVPQICIAGVGGACTEEPVE